MDDRHPAGCDPKLFCELPIPRQRRPQSHRPHHPTSSIYDHAPPNRIYHSNRPRRLSNRPHRNDPPLSSPRYHRPPALPPIDYDRPRPSFNHSSHRPQPYHNPLDNRPRPPPPQSHHHSRPPPNHVSHPSQHTYPPPPQNNPLPPRHDTLRAWEPDTSNKPGYPGIIRFPGLDTALKDVCRKRASADDLFLTGSSLLSKIEAMTDLFIEHLSLERISIVARSRPRSRTRPERKRLSTSNVLASSAKKRRRKSDGDCVTYIDSDYEPERAAIEPNRKGLRKSAPEGSFARKERNPFYYPTRGPQGGARSKRSKQVTKSLNDEDLCEVVEVAGDSVRPKPVSMSVPEIPVHSAPLVESMSLKEKNASVTPVSGVPVRDSQVIQIGSESDSNSDTSAFKLPSIRPRHAVRARALASDLLSLTPYIADDDDSTDTEHIRKAQARRPLSSLRTENEMSIFQSPTRRIPVNNFGAPLSMHRLKKDILVSIHAGVDDPEPVLLMLQELGEAPLNDIKITKAIQSPSQRRMAVSEAANVPDIREAAQEAKLVGAEEVGSLLLMGMPDTPQKAQIPEINGTGIGGADGHNVQKNVKKLSTELRPVTERPRADPGSHGHKRDERLILSSLSMAQSDKIQLTSASSDDQAPLARRTAKLHKSNAHPPVANRPTPGRRTQSSPGRFSSLSGSPLGRTDRGGALDKQKLDNFRLQGSSRSPTVRNIPLGVKSPEAPKSRLNSPQRISRRASDPSKVEKAADKPGASKVRKRSSAPATLGAAGGSIEDTPLNPHVEARLSNSFRAERANGIVSGVAEGSHNPFPSMGHSVFPATNMVPGSQSVFQQEPQFMQPVSYGPGLQPRVTGHHPLNNVPLAAQYPVAGPTPGYPVPSAHPMMNGTLGQGHVALPPVAAPNLSQPAYTPIAGVVPQNGYMPGDGMYRGVDGMDLTEEELNRYYYDQYKLEYLVQTEKRKKAKGG